jgi:hypothetical protein
MSRLPRILHVLWPGLIATWLAAQAPEVQAPRQLAAPVAEGGAADWRAPIHTIAALPDYGWWAVEQGYKVSFHDPASAFGFAFYPYLGAEAPENLPLQWRTTSVTAGGQELIVAGETPSHVHSDWRWEYHYRAFTEAYDVSKDGVEQTFTIAERPAAPGPIVVRGRVTTRLHATPVREQHGGIEFADAEGVTRVVYGAAWAIDARGERSPILTSFDGEEVELAVDARFVAEARFPLVIDPLTSPVVIGIWSGNWGLPVDSSIGREDESALNLMVAHARQFSASDYDLYVIISRDNFFFSLTVYRHVSASVSTREPSVASVGGANRWVVAYESYFPSSVTYTINAYVHDFANPTPQSGTLLNVTPSGRALNPRVGGQRSWTAGAMALVVWHRPAADNSSSEVYGRLVDAGAPGVRPPVLIGPDVFLAGGPAPNGVYRLWPCINQENGGGDGSWIVGWSERRGPSSNVYDLKIARISPAFLSPSTTLPHASLPNYKHSPRLAGRDGRYLLSFLTNTTLNGYGTALHVQRFDWPDSANAPTYLGPVRAIAQNTFDLFQGGVAFDTVSASHWAVVWGQGRDVGTSDVYAARVGYTGGTVELQTVYARPTTGAQSPSVTFDQRAESFPIAYCTHELGTPLLPVYSVRLTYPANAVSVLYGTGCGGTIGSTIPDAGSEFFRVTLAAGAQNPNQPAALFAAFQPSSIDLAVLGMPGCILNANPVVTFGMATNASGSASLTLPLQDAPVFLGDLYFQWAFLSPAVSWPLKVATTRGLRAQVR